MMSSGLHPGLALILAAVILPLLSGWRRQLCILLVPPVLLLSIFMLEEGSTVRFVVEGMFILEPFRVDRMAKLFLLVFGLMVCVGTLFAYRKAHCREFSSAFIYAGSAMGAVLAEDLISLFVFWEMMALASTFLIWSGGSPHSRQAGMRYVLIHLLGGVLLMVGIAGHYIEYHDLALQSVGLNGVSGWLILTGFLLNAGAPPLSAWLADAYPESSFSGMVFLSAFTTKTAVYVLMRGFAGTDILIWIGLFMIFYGIIYALLENDMRRILAYSIVNQVGFMVCGIGIGTEMALNGTAAHAFTHIIYKALLLMSAGSVLLMTGRRKCTELGGLVQSMPFTALCGIIGGLAISSFPLTSGFISKSMVTQAAVEGHLLYVWLGLQAASAGVFLHAGIKFPWFVFFQRDSGLRPSEPPWNMCLAMGILAFLCIALGVRPGMLYALLPYPVEYVPYTTEHVLAQLQLLLFSGLAFFLLLPWMQRTMTISLDFDWCYRVLLPGFVNGTVQSRRGLVVRLAAWQRTVWATCRAQAKTLSLQPGVSVNMLLILFLFSMCLACYLFWSL